MKRFLLFSFCLLVISSQAQVSYRKYTGIFQDIGGNEERVVLDLSQFDSSLYAHVFFPKKRATSVYYGNVQKDGSLKLKQESKSGNLSPAELSLNRNGITMTGDWTHGKETSAVDLTENVTPGSVKMAGLRFDSVCVARKGTASLEPIQATTKTGLLIVEGMKDSAAQNKINSEILASWLQGNPPPRWDTASARVLVRQATARIFKEYMSQYDTLRMNSTPEELNDMSWTLSWYEDNSMNVVFNDDNLLCLVLEGSSYSGGAHGSYFSSYAIYDTKEGKPVTLKQLLKPGYEVKLRLLAEKRLREDAGLQPGQTLSDGGYFVDELALNENYFVNRAGIGFVYNPYEIGPWAMGSTQVFLTYNEIRDLILPNGPLRWAIK